jgi:hypothetical protein
MNDCYRSGEHSGCAVASPLCKLRNQGYYDIVQSKFNTDSLRTIHGRCRFVSVPQGSQAQCPDVLRALVKHDSITSVRRGMAMSTQ